ncbi:ankyrin repeat domain-containing protein [Chitinophaga defluvii]|uniref:Ankyrin repeat domain-containing protein n=1 Tax=Chitinophaga defluvii TaxID=3163343 RepID=A0ABV2SZY0_9BACT
MHSLRISFIVILLAAINISHSSCAQEKKTMKQDPSGIFAAIQKNDTAAIRQWINQGNNLEVRNDKGETPLMAATYNNNIPVAQMLIAARADVNAQDHMQNSPFLYAGASGYLDILKLCMKAGARYDVYNRYGGTALIPACERGHVAIVAELLKDKTFPIDHINKLGWTGMLEAIILSDGNNKQVQIVQMLIDAGSNVNIADKDGVTPLAHARNRKFSHMVGILEKAGAR